MDSTEQAQKTPMSPAEFAKKMKELDKLIDPEVAHGNADDLICEVLRALGYGEGIEIYDNMTKWYA